MCNARRLASDFSDAFKRAAQIDFAVAIGVTQITGTM